MSLTGNQKRARLRLIRRRDRVRKDLPLRTPRAARSGEDDLEALDAVDPDLVGFTEEL